MSANGTKAPQKRPPLADVPRDFLPPFLAFSGHRTDPAKSGHGYMIYSDIYIYIYGIVKYHIIKNII